VPDDHPSRSDQSPREPLAPTAVRISVGLVALLAVGVVVVGLVLTSNGGTATSPPPTVTTGAPATGPLALPAVSAPDARSSSCSGLLDALPTTLADKGETLRRRPILEPAPPGAAAWAGDHGEPVVLRCGIPRPDQLAPTSELREISGVRWLPIEEAGAASWYVVDRPVYVALTVPAGSGTGPLQDVSTTVGKVLPAKPVRAG
jgi:uncharacterized protein DUF3515